MRADGRVAIYQLRCTHNPSPSSLRDATSPQGEARRKLKVKDMLTQPSVIAYGDANSLDAKTQFVASYAPRETVGRANVACDAGSI